MAWEKPAEDRPVWCSVGDEKSGVPTAESVNCVTKDPSGAGAEMARWSCRRAARKGWWPMWRRPSLPVTLSYKKFTSQEELGQFLVQHYKIRTPKDLTSCEVCHR
jgi:hypothetical protein